MRTGPVGDGCSAQRPDGAVVQIRFRLPLIGPSSRKTVHEIAASGYRECAIV